MHASGRAARPGPRHLASLPSSRCRHRPRPARDRTRRRCLDSARRSGVCWAASASIRAWPVAWWTAAAGVTTAASSPGRNSREPGRTPRESSSWGASTATSTRRSAWSSAGSSASPRSTGVPAAGAWCPQPIRTACSARALRHAPMPAASTSTATSRPGAGPTRRRDTGRSGPATTREGDRGRKPPANRRRAGSRTSSRTTNRG
jgi:hypothetical protein